MQQIKRTLWLMLSHSWITMIAIALLFALFLFFQFLTLYNGFEPEKSFQASLVLDIVLCAFTGIYMGGALLSLKQYYLWKVNPNFRKTLLKSFLIIVTTIYCLVLPGLIFSLGDKSWLYLLVPLCAAIYASTLVLEDKWLLRILIPAFPIGMAQLPSFGIPEIYSLIIVIGGAAIILYRMQLASNFRKLDNADRIRITITESTSIKPTLVFKINYYLSLLAEKLILRPKGNMVWAVSLPQTKLNLISLGYLIIVGVFILMTSKKDKNLLELFSPMFLTASFLVIVLESRQLFSQVKSFAHIFSANNHRQLKNTILRKVDINFISNAFTFSVGALVLSFLSPVQTNYQIVFGSLLIVMLVSLIFLPMMLSIQWLKVSFAQVGIASLYGFSIFGSLRWAGQNQDLLFQPLAVISVVSLFLLARAGTQLLFWQRPVERLVKCK
ncbi:hypothetical protein [Aliikangiella sp. G2MR2-5]|uniref:hypothetical protein n=1 Tax=Aliikangiella sp. G2MR2-5 TaxID=2788943 RepID=UPI0018AB3225|nr:hypothetical protein [Aliikangiella sp. G2MR2-5]